MPEEPQLSVRRRTNLKTAAAAGSAAATGRALVRDAVPRAGNASKVELVRLGCRIPNDQLMLSIDLWEGH